MVEQLLKPKEILSTITETVPGWKGFVLAYVMIAPIIYVGWWIHQICEHLADMDPDPRDFMQDKKWTGIATEREREIQAQIDFNENR